VKSELVDAPYVEEFPISLECKLAHTHELGLHTQFIGEIVDVKADESVLVREKSPDIEKIKPFVYGSHGTGNYHSIGGSLGRAFKIGKEIG